MTLAELHERIGWQLDGRLQFLASDGAWADWEIQCPPSSLQIAAHFRRRPDPPPMPDEIWIPQCDGPGLALDGQWYTNHMRCEKFGRPTRYIRADGVIDGKRLECRDTKQDSWKPATGWEYRLKP